MRPSPLPLLLAACGFEAPVDPDAPAVANTIAGEVVVNGLAAPAPIVILATHADTPPPPAGTGRPTTFTTVPPGDLTAGDAGVRAADYALAGVPDGDWILTGFADVDGDFHPAIDALAGATCGDIVGGHLADLTGRDLAAVGVSGGMLADGVTVLLGNRLPTERPAFVPLDAAGIPGVPVVSVDAALAGAPQGFALATTAVHARFPAPEGVPPVTLDLDGPYAVDPGRRIDPFEPPPTPWWDPFVPTCDVAFLVQAPDSDGDGAPDPHPDFPGLLDMWPHIGLTWLGVPVDDDGDGRPDRFDRAGREDETWVAPAVPSPLPVLQGRLPVGPPVLTAILEVAWVPVAVRTSRAGEELVTDPTAIPRGAWAISVITSTGQTWTVPNALVRASSTDAGFVPGLQGLYLLVE